MRHILVVAVSASLTVCMTTDKYQPEPVEETPAEFSSDYLGQPLPGSTPERFALGIVSTDALELNSTCRDLRSSFQSS